MTIGVLALQGDFAEHSAMLRRAGVEAAWSACQSSSKASTA